MMIASMDDVAAVDDVHLTQLSGANRYLMLRLIRVCALHHKGCVVCVHMTRFFSLVDRYRVRQSAKAASILY